MPQAQAALGYAALLGGDGGVALRRRLAARAFRRAQAAVRRGDAGRGLDGGGAARRLAVGRVCSASRSSAPALAPVAPILFNAATRVPGVSRAAAIASVTSIGYGGFMVGPPLIGALAHAASLSVALGVVVVGAAALALGARFVPARP